MCPAKATTRFRELIENPRVAVGVGGCLPIHARMVEQAGFDFFQVGGTMVSAWMVGWADVGVLTLTEMTHQLGLIASVTDLPVFGDADTGYGSAVNVWRTTQEFIRCGVAGMQLEDQVEPKMTGDRSGKRVLPMDEALGKFRAAMDAKRELDNDFVVVARTDARNIIGGTLEDTVRRGCAFHSDAGVDAVFYEGLMSWDECRYAISETPVPTVCILDPSAGQLPDLDEQTRAGHALAIYPRIITNAANDAGWDQLMEFKERGVQATVDYMSNRRNQKWQFDFESLVKFGYERVREMEEAYLPQHLWRDYGDAGPESVSLSPKRNPIQ
jgi:2-methylisocitrate lyase-like PEP mutase family enzyme